MPIVRRSLARSRDSGTASILAINFAAQPGGAPFVSIGRHRLHGRYPANIACRGVKKYSTFCGRGALAVHEGRQKIPVVLTAVKKMPSYVASRRVCARRIS